MLAPRKKLWSTPKEALQAAVELLQLCEEDEVWELGCGEGDFLQLCLTAAHRPKHVVGVEIEEGRLALVAEKLSAYLQEEGGGGLRLVAGNVLEQDFRSATCLFFYFIPRGLRLLYPLLKAIPHPVRIVSFMNPLPGEEQPLKTVKVGSEKVPEAAWPLFYYELNQPPPPAASGASDGDGDGEDAKPEGDVA